MALQESDSQQLPR